MEDQINRFQFSPDRVDEETEVEQCWDELSDGRLVLTKNKLKIRFKMPKAKHREEETTDKQGNSEDHVCKHCNKIFSSGKALGGHMGVHNSEREENADSTAASGYVEKISFPMRPLNHPNKADTTCKVCMRTFPSEKSLFGHMRCHPERTWRGINPPQQSAKNSSSSTVNSVSLKIDDQNDSATTWDRPTFGRAPPLGSWPVTAKRGRKIAIPVPPQKAAKLDDEAQDPLLEAVINLLMLAQGDSKDSALWKKKRGSEELEEPVEEFKAKKAKRLELEFDSSDGSELENMNIDPRSENLNTSGHSNDSEESERMTVNQSKQLNYIIGMNKRKRKQKFRALDRVSNGRYTCSTCNKQFDCHRALGGHRASHGKYKSTSSAQVDEEGTADADENNPNGTEREGCIDSNKSHRCKICNKCFPSGQALGGHKRCHWVAHPEPAVTSATSPDDVKRGYWVAPPESAATSATSQNDDGKRCHWVPPSEPVAASATSPDDVEMPCFRALDFDLNQMPPVEEEDGGILFHPSFYFSLKRSIDQLA